MKKYEKPEVLLAEGLSEKIYMGSGASAASSESCWSVKAEDAGNNGWAHQWVINSAQKAELDHECFYIDYIITFNKPLSFFSSNGGAASMDGNTGTVRVWPSGNSGSFEIWAQTNDAAGNDSIQVTSISWICTEK